MKYKINISSLINFILPRTCIVCGAPNQDLCPSCRLKIIVAPQFCPVCSKKYKLGFICHACKSKDSKMYFDAIYIHSNSEQKIVTRCINSLRDKGQKNIGMILGKLVNNSVMMPLSKKVASKRIIVPLPLTKLETRQRGYNQNLILAQGFNHLNLFEIVNRSLSFKKRKKKPYTWKADHLNQASVIIISDYLAEDRLIEELSKTLKEAGAQELIFIALSRKL